MFIKSAIIGKQTLENLAEAMRWCGDVICVKDQMKISRFRGFFTIFYGLPIAEVDTTHKIP